MSEVRKPLYQTIKILELKAGFVEGLQPHEYEAMTDKEAHQHAQWVASCVKGQETQEEKTADIRVTINELELLEAGLSLVAEECEAAFRFVLEVHKKKYVDKANNVALLKKKLNNLKAFLK